MISNGKFLVFSLSLVAIVFLIGTVSVLFAEASNTIPSPRQQLESGVSPEDIVCKENRVLVLRANGSPACVTEKISEKLGWEIIVTEFGQKKSTTLQQTITKDNVVKSSSIVTEDIKSIHQKIIVA